MTKHLILGEIAKKYGNILCKEFIADNKSFMLLKQNDGEFIFPDTSAHDAEKTLVNFLLSNGIFNEDFVIK